MGRKNMCTVTVRTDTCVIRSSVCNELRTIPIVNVQVKIMCVQILFILYISCVNLNIISYFYFYTFYLKKYMIIYHYKVGVYAYTYFYDPFAANFES